MNHEPIRDRCCQRDKEKPRYWYELPSWPATCLRDEHILDFSRLQSLAEQQTLLSPASPEQHRAAAAVVTTTICCRGSYQKLQRAPAIIASTSVGPALARPTKHGRLRSSMFVAKIVYGYEYHGPAARSFLPSVPFLPVRSIP